MQPQFSAALENYFEKWYKLADSLKDKSLLKSLKPVALGWKVADRAEYDELYAALHDQCDHIVETWMNGRWIAKMHLKQAELAGGITIIKLMQRRPDSTDAVGLDHVDFYSAAMDNAEALLKDETELKWSWESNDAVESYEWISLWFDGTEAKLKSNTVLDIVASELTQMSAQIKGK